MKELEELVKVHPEFNIQSINNLTGRKVVEVRGPMPVMWNILSRSRIVEDVQLRMTQSFLARGETELRRNLQKIPW